MNYEFLEPAEDELQEAVDYYDRQRIGLGAEFDEEVEHAINGICQFPGLGAPIGGGYRRTLTSRFPYGSIYKVRNSKIVIVAVMHMNREPGYWKARWRQWSKGQTDESK